MKKRTILIGLLGLTFIIGSARGVWPPKGATQKTVEQDIVRHYQAGTRKRFGYAKSLQELRHHRSVVIKSTTRRINLAKKKFPNLPDQQVLENAKKYIQAEYVKKEKEFKK